MTEMSARVRAMLEESALAGSGDELVDLLAGLEQRYVDEAAPEPGPELARLLDGGQPTARSTRSRNLGSRRTRRIAAAGALALSTVVGTGVAAAANELPPPAQRWLAELSDRFLHVDLPRPATAPAELVKERGAGGHDAKAEEHDARPLPPSGPPTPAGHGDGRQTDTSATSGLHQRRDAGERDETTSAERDDGSRGDAESPRTRAPEPDGDAASDDTANREVAPSTDDRERLDGSREVEGPGGEAGRDG